MSPSLIITPTVTAPVVTVAAEARQQRDTLLADAATVTTVADRLDADCATAVLRQLTDFDKEIETTREAVKAPVMEVPKATDSTLRGTVQFEVTNMAALYKAHPELVTLAAYNEASK